MRTRGAEESRSRRSGCVSDRVMRGTLTYQASIKDCRTYYRLTRAETNVELCLTRRQEQFSGSGCSIECAQASKQVSYSSISRVFRRSMCTWLHESRINNNSEFLELLEERILRRKRRWKVLLKQARKKRKESDQNGNLGQKGK